MPRCDWDAADYERHSSAQQQWARELIDKLHLRGDEILLDIGCGDGKVTAEIAARLPGGFVVGVDNSEEMIALARSRFPAGDHANLSFVLGDARSLPFRDAFSAVFSNAALHWVRDHGPVLAGIFGSAKRGARITLSMGGRGNADGILVVLDEMLQAEEWRLYFHGFTMPYGFHGPDEYRVWLRESGLTPRRVELVDKNIANADRAGLEGWVRTTWLPYTQRVPAERRDEFVSRLVDRYLELHPPDARGVIHVHMVRLEIEAVK
jgi:trans-aconitate 2-methyltransferase